MKKESIRQQKVARLVQRDLSEIFQKLQVSHLGGAMVTVTVVRVTPDLAYARVFNSFFGKEANTFYLDLLNKHKGLIRKELGLRVKKQLRIVPELEFQIDDSISYASEIDALLKK